MSAESELYSAACDFARLKTATAARNLQEAAKAFATEPRESILDIPMPELKKLVRQYGLGTITDATRQKGKK